MFKKLLRWSGFVLLVLVLLLLLLWGALQLPSVQQRISDKAMAYLSEQTQGKFELEQIEISFFNRLRLQGLYVEDYVGDTLLYAETLEVQLSLFAPFQQELGISSISLSDATVQLKRGGDGRFNFDHITEAFASEDPDTTDSAAPWALDLGRLRLQEVRFSFTDSLAGTAVYTRVGDFDAKLRGFDLAEERIHLQTLRLSDSFARLSTWETGQAAPSPDTSAAPLAFPFTGWAIAVDAIAIAQFGFAYDDFSQAPGPAQAFDAAHLYFEDMELKSKAFRWDAEQLSGQIEQMAFREANGFELSQFSADFSIGPESIEVKALQLASPGSKLPPSSLSLHYAAFADLARFTEAVELRLDLGDGQLAWSDLAYWAGPLPYVLPEKAPPLELSGQVRGRVEALKVETLRVGLGQALQLRANGRLNGLPELEQLGMALNLSELSLDAEALQSFTKGLDLPEGLYPLGRVQLTTRLDGNMQRLKIAPLRLRTAAYTAFDGSLELRDLLNPKTMQFKGVVEQLQAEAADLEGFTGGPQAQLQALGKSLFQGEIAGTLYRFTVAGALQSEAGELDPSLLIHFEEDYSNAKYEGEMVLRDLDLGRLLDNEPLGCMSMEVRVQGEGLSLDSLDARVDALIRSLEYQAYTYKDMVVNGQFKAQQFDGSFEIDDPNLRLRFDGLANLNDSLPDFRFTALLDTLQLAPLYLYDSPLNMHANLDVRLRGNSLDNLVGRASLTELTVRDEEQAFQSKSIVLQAEEDDQGYRRLSLDSRLLRARLSGSYTLAGMAPALLGFIDGFFPLGKLVAPSDTGSVVPQQLALELSVGNLEQLAAIFLPELQALDTAWFNASFDSEARQLEVNSFIPSLTYSGISLDSLTFVASNRDERLEQRLTAKHIRQDTNVLVPLLEAWAHFFQDSLTLGLQVDGQEEAQRLALELLLEPLGEQYRLQVLPGLMVDGEPWSVAEGHSVMLGAGRLRSDGLRLSNEQQFIEVQSQAAPDSVTFPPLDLQVANFQLQALTAMAGMEADYLSGLLSGTVKLSWPDSLLRYAAQVTVDSLTLNSQSLGQLKLNAQPENGGAELSFGVSLNQTRELLALSGQYGLEDGAIQASLKADGLPFAPFSFLSQGAISDSRGRVSAGLDISGTTASPLAVGTLSVDSLSTFVEALQTRFLVPQHSITLEESRIRIGNLPLIDSQGKRASLSGEIRHKNYADFVVDLNFNAPSFLVLDSGPQDNDLFYGKVLLRADARIRGPIDDLQITVQTTTLPGTKLTALPLGGEQSIAQEDFIIYALPSEYHEDSTELALAYRVNSSGYNLSLKLDLTPDAEIIAIIDPATGDQLRARGRANLLVQLDAAGQLSTTGEIYLSSGSYQLNYEGLIKRDFLLEEGSTISLPGDPLKARFDITALYKAEAPVFDLIRQEAELGPEQERAARRRQPMEVLMNMEGTLEAPNISFDLRAGSRLSGSLQEVVGQKLSRLREDPNAINKQVFGLLLFNSFFTESSGGGNLASAGENIALSSVSSLLSNQLNRLADQYVEGVDLNVGIASYNTGSYQGGENVTEVTLGMSKQLFNDRLSVELGGNLGVSDGGAAEQQTVLAGDFLLSYKLTEDGRYQVKVFRRPDYDIFSIGIRTGGGIAFRRSFGGLSPASAKEAPIDSLQVKPKDEE